MQPVFNSSVDANQTIAIESEEASSSRKEFKESNRLTRRRIKKTAIEKTIAVNSSLHGEPKSNQIEGFRQRLVEGFGWMITNNATSCLIGTQLSL